MKIFGRVLVKEKDLQEFYDIADVYFSSYGGFNIEKFSFINYFRKKYKLEKKK